MKVTIHSIYDKLTKENINYGTDYPGYNRCMAELNAGKYSDKDRYEYFGRDMDIKFMWDMTEAEFRAVITSGKDSEGDDMSDYCGAVFFGDFKLEFVWNDVAGAYNNLFLWGAEYDVGRAYGYLEDGTPYEELYPDFGIAKRRTFVSFAKRTEETVVKWLNDHPEFLEYALGKTDPTKWYPGGQCNVTRDITRIA